MAVSLYETGESIPFKVRGHTLAKKIKQLSKVNNRPYNKEIEWILRNYIEKFESDNGEFIVKSERNSL